MSSFRKISSTSSSEDDGGEQLRRGPWTLEEDSLLIHFIASHGEGRWNSLAKSAGNVFTLNEALVIKSVIYVELLS